jgi:hypothetical protein
VTNFSVKAASASEDDIAVMQKYMPMGRHRIDLSYSETDTFIGDVSVFMPTYTWAPRQYLRFSVTGSIVKNDLVLETPQSSGNGPGETGVGDTTFGIQYDPSAKLTASPWVPDTVGLSAQVLAPTGSAKEGLGIDTWYANVGAGWAVDWVNHIWLVPAVGYEFTFAEGSQAVSSSKPYVGLDFAWVFQFGGWIGAGVQAGYEFDADEWVDESVITFGKMFQNGFGLSIDYGQVEQLAPQANRDDRNWLINFYFQFGKPPGR